MVFAAFCREVRGGFPDGRAYVGVKMRAFPVEAELPDDLTADERRVVEDAHAGRATVFPAHRRIKKTLRAGEQCVRRCLLLFC